SVPSSHHSGARRRLENRLFACDRLIGVCRTRLRLVHCRPYIPLQEHIETGGCGVRKVEGISAVIPIAIIGAGGWGTALAITMARANRDVRLWAYETYLVETIIATRENPIYLPSVRVPDSVRVSHSIEEALRGAGVV